VADAVDTTDKPDPRQAAALQLALAYAAAGVEPPDDPEEIESAIDELVMAEGDE
jgi:hypothetical protein